MHVVITKEVQRHPVCTHTCSHMRGYIAILCTQAIACVTADGILIAKSILNYRMTAHLRRQAALLSRA